MDDTKLGRLANTLCRAGESTLDLTVGLHTLARWAAAFPTCNSSVDWGGDDETEGDMMEAAGAAMVGLLLKEGSDDIEGTFRVAWWTGRYVRPKR